MDHTVVHFEIPAEEPERAVTFYQGLFGWNIQKWGDASSGMEYWMISTVPTDDQGRPTRPGINGGLMRRKDPKQPFANFISVESVDQFLAKATELGGEVALPKMPVPGMGWFGYFKDTEGNIIGLWENDPNAG